MSTLEQSITGLSSNDPVPGVYLEVAFAQGEVAGASGVPKVLFIGPKVSSGTATTNTQVYQLTGVEDAKVKGGQGSPVHRMLRRFSEVCKSAQVYGIFTVNSTGGTTSKTRITLANPATSGTGVITYTLCGEKIQVAVPKNTTATAAATSLVSEINLQTHWPVIAAKGTGATVDVTSKLKGKDTLAIRNRIEITSGINMTATVGHEHLTGGTLADSYTTALATIEPTQYDYIVPACNFLATSDTRCAALKAQIVAQALPTEGCRQQVIVAHAGTQSTAGTFVANSIANHPRFQCLWQENSEWEPMEVAAQFAGVRYSKEVSNPVYNFDSHGKRVNDIWNVPKQYAASDEPTRTEISAAISAGLTPVAANGSRSYIVRGCTCSTDVRVRDTSKVTTADKFAADLGARYESQWSSANLQDDPSDSNVQVAPNVITPSKLKALTIVPLYIRYSQNGWLDSSKTLAAVTGDVAVCATGIDPINPTRVNARIPLHVTPQCHQFAALISENSAG